MQSGKHIRSLSSLDKEINRLRKEARSLEKELDDNFNYLRRHYPSLALNSLLPESTAGKSIPALIVAFILQHEKLRGILQTLGSKLAERFSAGLEWIIDKIFPGKE